MKNRISILLSVIITVGVLLSGCENGVDFLINGTEETETIQMSSNIYMPIENVRTLNPVISKDEDTYYIGRLVYEGLFELDGSLQAQPLLAQSYVYEDDGDSILIELKKNVFWHDGETFTATDVKFSIDCYLNVLYSNLSIYNGYVDNIKSAKVKDDYTIQIFFKDNTDVAVEKLTFPIIPKHQFKNVNAVRNSTEKFVPIGTGPYKVESVDVNKEILLTANPLYHGSVKAQNQVCFKVLPSRLDAVNLFSVNDLTTTFSKEIDRDTLVNNKEVQVASFPSNEVELIGFNCRKPAFNNALVRKAIAYTIDVDEILEIGYYNSGVRSDNVYYPGYMGADSDGDLLSVDLEQAKKLLEDAGYYDRDGNGFVEDAGGEEISIEILVNEDDASRVAAAQIIRDGLAKLPIHVSVLQTDWNTYYSKLTGRDYDIYIGGYRIQDDFDMRFLLHSETGNPAGYENPELDELLDRMGSAITAEEKRKTFGQIKEILNDETPYYCLFYKTYGLISSTGLTGDIRPYFFHPYNQCENWMVAYRIQKPSEEQEVEEQETETEE